MNFSKLIIEQLSDSCLHFKTGGPFGAVVIKDNKIVGKGVNKVIAKHDPTAHAEVEAIRDACINLQTHDLTGCELYATGFPCPMCMSAIIWANIKKVYYSCDYKDAEEIGFRDRFIFDFIKNDCKDNSILTFAKVEDNDIKTIYKKWQQCNNQKY